MVRPKKPIDELSPAARRARLLREENPKLDEAYRKYQKESYRKKNLFIKLEKNSKLRNNEISLFKN